nr:alpha/beta hydrolase [Indioceanicola profundi]
MPETKTEEQIRGMIKKLAHGFGYPIRSPLLHRPSDHGLSFENVTFPSEDGVPLEAWFIPCEGSRKLIIANHPLSFSRTGLPAHMEPWKSTFGDFAGNDFEVNFIPDYKILHDNGYNVLTYDFRNFGHSGAANGGMQSNGQYECRDVIGSLNYARSQSDLSDMTIGLFSRCLGAGSSMFAMACSLSYFEDVRCMVGGQPISVRSIMERTLEHFGLQDRIDEFEQEQKLITSFDLDEMSPVEPAKSVSVPTFLFQVRDDVLTRPSDVQAMFDNIPVADKKLHWIEGATRRWGVYCWFQREPKQSLEWFECHMN